MPDTLRSRDNAIGKVMTRARFLLISLLFCAATAHAQRMYVTDELVITLRTGPSTQNTVIANLNTGDAVEVLEVDEAAGYTRIGIVGDDAEGWVLTRYLMPEPTTDQALTQAQAELAEIRQRASELESELARVSDDLMASNSALDAAEESHQQVSSELSDIREASSNVIELQNRNESLRRTNIELSAEVDTLTTETSRLGSRNSQNWFVVGALVLAFGIVIGLIAPSLRSRKRSNW